MPIRHNSYTKMRFPLKQPISHTALMNLDHVDCGGLRNATRVGGEKGLALKAKKRRRASRATALPLLLWTRGLGRGGRLSISFTAVVFCTTLLVGCKKNADTGAASNRIRVGYIGLTCEAP